MHYVIILVSTLTAWLVIWLQLRIHAIEIKKKHYTTSKTLKQFAYAYYIIAWYKKLSRLNKQNKKSIQNSSYFLATKSFFLTMIYVNKRAIAMTFVHIILLSEYWIELN